MDEENVFFRYDNVRFLPGQQIGLHEQDTWELSYISVGSGMRLIGDMTMPFGSGEVVLIPPGVPHCWYFDGKECDAGGHIANISLMFSSRLLSTVEAAFPQLAECIGKISLLKDAVAFAPDVACRLSALLREMENVGECGRIGCVIRLLAEIGESGGNRVVGVYRNMDKAQRRMDRIRTYVICNHGRHVAVDDVARFVGMNKSAFCVFFRKMAGKTFVEYLNGYRMQMACRMLAKGDRSVSEVCYAVGFGDVPYFHRMFKRMTGTTPGKYKEDGSTE